MLDTAVQNFCVRRKNDNMTHKLLDFDSTGWLMSSLIGLGPGLGRKPTIRGPGAAPVSRAGSGNKGGPERASHRLARLHFRLSWTASDRASEFGRTQ